MKTYRHKEYQIVGLVPSYECLIASVDWRFMLVWLLKTIFVFITGIWLIQYFWKKSHGVLR